ncbi:MerR family transcriptional regulator [Kineosporia succinea]|uniref:DNA-binding transcriptional MerR regulator n=1 Tax=Kineosporia succinea TaxID=84632 RepID=A0ABT9P7J1_9ACTN|nr:MerR family transcriptional regulator [Kineosporia succinea]MDP9828422.1 DNA-binding transcriptional MerR regulator [Kineosporia succinea]
MRIGELARLSGVPVPSIKYYLREGMLPVGERISANQVRYTDAHVRRVRLIRALLEVGGLSIAATREILGAVDTPGGDLHSMLGVAQSAVSREVGDNTSEADRRLAEDEVAKLAERHGWGDVAAKRGNPGWRQLVQIVATYRGLEQHELLGLLDRYAQAAALLAEAELGVIASLGDTDEKVEGVVLGTLLGDAAMAAMRRIAQEAVSARP